MQPSQLKKLIDDGRYRPEPELVADAMLNRHGVRELLTGRVAEVSQTAADRTPAAAPEDRPRAA